MPTTDTLTRRQAVGAAGAAGAAVVLAKLSGPGRLLESLGLDATAQAQAASCVLTPDRTEGPYFVDEKLNRSDIRVDPSDGAAQPGTPLTLTLVVVDAANDCAPVAGAQVDIWHANAVGRYSNVASEGTTGKRYLRGFQATDAAGRVTFTTIYPGWYPGRAIHIHFKVRAPNGTSFTSQMFFDPAVSSAVMAQGAYASRGQPNTPNAGDGIYGADGARLVVPLAASGGGYAGTFVVGVSGLAPQAAPGATSPAPANTVDAALRRARFVRTRTGRRTLRLTLDVDETVTVTARVSRSGRTLAKKTRSLRPGTRTLDVRIPRATKRGAARVSLRYADAVGLGKRAARTVTIPKPRR